MAGENNARRRGGRDGHERAHRPARGETLFRRIDRWSWVALCYCAMPANFCGLIGTRP